MIGAVNIKLSDDEITQLEQKYLPQAAFGHT